jgi:phosphatidylserine/phosphatidylglycerophosphate/cardiolipin synthase-like enzyme
MTQKIKNLLLYIIIAPVLLVGCVHPTIQYQTPTITSSVQVYFTPGTTCENKIIQQINQANKIDIAVYSITNPQIGDAIINAHNRGASIRIITDRTQSKGKKSLVNNFINAGIPLHTNKKHKIEHNKFAIFDNNYIVSGSYNWTTNASKHNSENCIFFHQPNQEFTNRFEYLWQLYSK